MEPATEKSPEQRGIARFLNNPYPFSNQPRILLVYLGLSVSVVLFLYFFQPFDLAEYQNLLLICLGFGGIVFSSLSLVLFAFPKVVPKWFNEENWRVWKEILHLAVACSLIGIANFFYLNSLGYAELSFLHFFIVLSNSFLVSVITILIWVVINYNRMLKQYLQEAQWVNKELQDKLQEQIPTPNESVLTFQSESGKQSITLPKESLIFVESVGNYVEFNFLKDNRPTKQQLRNKMKVIEEQLLETPDFFRCHRAFLINLDFILSVEGNAKGLTMHVKHTHQLIPVARSKTKALRDRLSS